MKEVRSGLELKRALEARDRARSLRQTMRPYGMRMTPLATDETALSSWIAS